MNQSKKNCGKCSRWFMKRRTPCCEQVIGTTFFKSTQAKHEFGIFQHINYISKWIIYLLECNLSKIQYVWKYEEPFNICLNNRRMDVKDTRTIEADKYFTLSGHNFSANSHTITYWTVNKQNERTNRQT